MVAIETIDGTHDDEDDESDEQKIDDVLNEVAIGDMGDGVGTEDIGDIDGKLGEVKTASEEAGDRHNDIVDK